MKGAVGLGGHSPAMEGRRREGDEIDGAFRIEGVWVSGLAVCNEDALGDETGLFGKRLRKF